MAVFILINEVDETRQYEDWLDCYEAVRDDTRGVIIFENGEAETVSVEEIMQEKRAAEAEDRMYGQPWEARRYL